MVLTLLRGDNVIETLNKLEIDKDHLKMIIAFEIKKARMSAGLTQEAVLRETGVHVGRIEMGKSSIDVCTFLKLCIFLDVDIQKIICKLQALSKNTYSSVIVKLDKWFMVL